MRPLVPRALLVATTVVAAGLALPTPAQAVTVTNRVWSVVDSDGDGWYGLWYSDGAGGTPHKVEEASGVSVYDLSASTDGSRVIYVRDTFNGDFSAAREEIVVRDLSENVVRALGARTISETSSSYAFNPALSPDGTRAVWELFNFDTGTYTTRKSPVGAGAASTLAAYGVYSFLDNDTVLVQDADGNPFSQPYAGGAATAVAGLPIEALDAVVSPDGASVAFGLYDTSTATGTPDQADLQIAPLTNTSGVWSVGTPTTLDSTLYNTEPAFSRDGSTVFYVKDDGDPSNGVDNGDIWSVPAAGGTAAVVSATSDDDVDVAVTNQPGDDTTAPGAATSAASYIANGTSATIGWTLPSDTDLSGVKVTRTQTDNSAVVTRFYPAPLTSAVDTGLIVGKTYSYVFQSVDRSGNLSTASEPHLMTAMGGPSSFPDPTSRVYKRAPFLVRFAGPAPGNVLFTVDYSINGGGWRTWVTSRPGSARTFGSAATTGVAATTSVPGQTYRFRISAVDGYGNSTAQAVSAKAVVPFDQTRAATSGGANAARSDSWLGTVRILSSSVNYARIAIVGDRFQLIGERCPTCGVVDIYDGSTRIASVDTRASTRQARVVLYTRLWGSVVSRTITLRPRGTAGRPNVVLDGFAIRR